MLSHLTLTGLMGLLFWSFCAADTSIVENKSIAWIGARGKGSSPLPISGDLLAAPAPGSPTQVLFYLLKLLHMRITGSAANPTCRGVGLLAAPSRLVTTQAFLQQCKAPSV